MANIIFGRYSYGDIRLVGGTLGKVIIGKYCSIGEDVVAFMSFDHNMNNISTFSFDHRKTPIRKMMKLPIPHENRTVPKTRLRVNIGNDVWIGSHAVLFKGITIGDGAVIGAYSKITKDIPPYSVVVGDNRIIKKRFSDRDIEFLLKLKWWDFSDKEIAEITPILCSPDVYKLRERYG